ncbi:MAG: hypothetical protein J6T44_05725 [Prevotella sp.]|nr:hypothetical protein [Prevotella sp.]
MAGNNQVRFAVPYFDVFDPRLPDHGEPMAVRGTMTFIITDFEGHCQSLLCSLWCHHALLCDSICLIVGYSPMGSLEIIDN